MLYNIRTQDELFSRKESRAGAKRNSGPSLRIVSIPNACLEVRFGAHATAPKAGEDALPLAEVVALPIPEVSEHCNQLGVVQVRGVAKQADYHDYNSSPRPEIPGVDLSEK